MGLFLPLTTDWISFKLKKLLVLANVVTGFDQVLVKDLLRKYPQWSHDCIAVVGSVSSKTVTEPKAKSALVWMLGEYAYDMPDAPYILEGFIENWNEEDSAEVFC